MGENNFETEEERQAYMQAVIGICYKKDCMVGRTYKTLIWPKYCTPHCDCRQTTEAAARAAVETKHDR